MTLDLKVVGSSPVLGVEVTKNDKNLKREREREREKDNNPYSKMLNLFLFH